LDVLVRTRADFFQYRTRSFTRASFDVLGTRRLSPAFPEMAETLRAELSFSGWNAHRFAPVPVGVTTSDERDPKAVFEMQVLPEVPVLLRVARSMTSQPADAHDLVQDTLLRAWRSIDTFDGRYVRSWLLTIMRNAEHNRHRRKRPDPIDLTEASNYELRHQQRSASAEQDVMDTRFDEAVTAGLASLSPDFRQAVFLVDVDGLSYAEAAAILGVPEGTVMSRLHRARKRIRDRVVESRKLQHDGSFISKGEGSKDGEADISVDTTHR